MTTLFDHRATGTPEQAWAPVLAGLPRLRLPDLPVVVLAAHPDDETLGAGGLIRAAAGRSVTVLVASDGAASHPDSPTHPPARLAAIRREEVRAAVAALDPAAELRLLHLPDGDLASRIDEIDEAVTATLDGPALLVSPWRGDRHPDHEACARAAERVAAARPDVTHWQYPIWAWHWRNPAEPVPGLARLDLGPAHLAAKRAALACHASQHRPLSSLAGDEAILPPHVVAHFERDCEAFVVAHPAAEAAYFDELYAGSDDPWGLAGRFYEARKRDLVLAALPRARFRRAFEPGCATGLLTAGLAARCERVVAWDGAQHAVELARERLGGHRNARVARGRIPTEWPPGRFDLIVLSEVGYYCPDLARLAERVEASLDADGVLVAAHWRHPAPDHPHTAEQVHGAIGASLRRVVSHVEEDFVLEVWSRAGESVARATGVLA